MLRHRRCELATALLLSAFLGLSCSSTPSREPWTRSSLWPPVELAAGPVDAQPGGAGWRTAQWNVCTTSMDGPALECRARIAPEDETRTAAKLERAAIAKLFSQDVNLYSFTLQEICERDVRWIAAFVARGGPPAAGWDEDFTADDYREVDRAAPYAFLPYLTHEMLGERDVGCGAGISTGLAAIAKHVEGRRRVKTRGLTNATYAEHATTGLRDADLREPEVCALYFEHQTSWDYPPPPRPERDDPRFRPVTRREKDGAGPFRSVDCKPTDPTAPPNYLCVRNFRSRLCASSVPDTLRGTACVGTWWQGDGDDQTYPATTCAIHAVHRGEAAAIVRNQQIAEAARQVTEFAGGEDRRAILGGDFNVRPAKLGESLGDERLLDQAQMGHAEILAGDAYGFTKVTVGAREGSTDTGTHRGNPEDRKPSGCDREIDAVYVRGDWWLNGETPHPSTCADLPLGEPSDHGPQANPYEWSDHVMMVSPLLSPHGAEPPDF